MIAIEKPAWYVGSMVFPTQKKAEEFLKVKDRLEAFILCTGDDDTNGAIHIYTGLLSSPEKRENFRRWLDRLDKIGDEPPKLDLI